VRPVMTDLAMTAAVPWRMCRSSGPHERPRYADFHACAWSARTRSANSAAAALRFT
jgi:hypothetical protein